MPNIVGGKNYKRGKKNPGNVSGKKIKTPWIEDEPDCIYGYVEKKLGGNRIEARCSDRQIRQVIIPGAFHKKIWINPQDVILVQIDSLNPKGGYIRYKYNPDEISELKSKGINFDIDNNKKKSSDINFSNNLDPELLDDENNTLQNNFDKLTDHEKRMLKKDKDLNISNQRTKKENLLNSDDTCKLSQTDFDLI